MAARTAYSRYQTASSRSFCGSCGTTCGIISEPEDWSSWQTQCRCGQAYRPMLSSYRTNACRCVSAMRRIDHDPNKKCALVPQKLRGRCPTSTVDRAALQFCDGTIKRPLCGAPVGPLGWSPVKYHNTDVGFLCPLPAPSSCPLEEDKGPDHDVLAASRIGGRRRVGTGSMERPARNGAVGHRVIAFEHRDLGRLLLGNQYHSWSGR